jgi:hypothetical protein
MSNNSKKPKKVVDKGASGHKVPKYAQREDAAAVQQVKLEPKGKK